MRAISFYLKWKLNRFEGKHQSFIPEILNAFFVEQTLIYSYVIRRKLSESDLHYKLFS